MSGSDRQVQTDGALVSLLIIPLMRQLCGGLTGMVCYLSIYLSAQEKDTSIFVPLRRDQIMAVACLRNGKTDEKGCDGNLDLKEC